MAEGEPRKIRSGDGKNLKQRLLLRHDDSGLPDFMVENAPDVGEFLVFKPFLFLSFVIFHGIMFL